MNYMFIDQFDTANGLGIGTVLWVAGCSHHCPGCHNPEAQNPDAGTPFGFKQLQFLILTLKQPHITRLTLSGGDPLSKDNRHVTFKIVCNVKFQLPDKSIWVYTGYDWDSIKHLELMKYVDVLVDGRFILSKRNLNLKYKGSSNQRVIDVQQSLIQGNPIELPF